MTIEEMHYDFKKKLNKVDSNQNRNLLIPEIDWALNEAQEIFIKLIVQPRVVNHLGFEKNQRTRDDISSIVKSDNMLVLDNIVSLPKDYMFFISGDVLMEKDGCGERNGSLCIRQHDDDFESSPFDKSSFEWKTVNGVFVSNGIKLFDDGTFINKKLLLNYIKKPVYIHNAKDFGNGGIYRLPSGMELSGFVNCELPEHTHREIVDIAVALIAGELLSSDYQVKLGKLNINELK